MLSKLLLICGLLSACLTIESKFRASKKSELSADQLTTTPTRENNDIPDVPIYYEGWVKYISYSANQAGYTKTFYKNTAYNQQMRTVTSDEMAQNDDKGFLKIPSELYFYGVLYKDGMDILTARDNAMTSVKDSLNLAYIKNIPESDNYSGGVTDFGTFDEGSCFKIQSKIPSTSFVQNPSNIEPSQGVEQFWVVCVDKEEDKIRLMNTIIKLKLKMQHTNGLFLDTPDKNKDTTGFPLDQGPQIGTSNMTSPLDGYWVLLQNWTDCTLKCGGGLQYQQLMCVPPKTGGKPCEGSAINTRPCNIQPCPTAAALVKALPNATSTQKTNVRPIVKVMAISSRPQRYDKCYIKETDALMEKRDESTKELSNYPRIPVRLVMNDKTVTAFMDDSLTDRITTYILDESAFVRVHGNPTCFFIKNNVKKDMFCQLDTVAGNFVEDWDYDFNLFKNQCRTLRAKSDKYVPEEAKLQQDFNNKVDNMKQDLAIEKTQLIKARAEQKEELQLTNTVDRARKTSLEAVNKEFRLEQLLEKEEAAKEAAENQKLEVQIQQEKERDACLQKTLKEKELENQYNIAKSHAEDDLKKIKEDTQKEIIKKRNQIKKRIIEMKQEQNRKQSHLRNEIMVIRTKLAEKIKNVNKMGNSAICTNLTKKQDYCDVNFSDNYVKYEDCLSDNYCYSCCENEFGELHVLERDKCYDLCTDNKSS